MVATTNPRARQYLRALLVLLLAHGASACQTEMRDDAPEALRAEAPAAAPALPSFCRRPGADPVRDLFCVPGASVGSLAELLRRLDIDTTGAEFGSIVPEGVVDRATVGATLSATLSILGHSTALPGRLVSPINPRAILLGARTVAAFQRGVQRIELASRTGERGPYHFYLLTFRQACNAQPEGCRPGDLYTPAVESGWTFVNVEDDEDLKNTEMDCRQCDNSPSYA